MPERGLLTMLPISNYTGIGILIYTHKADAQNISVKIGMIAR